MIGAEKRSAKARKRELKSWREFPLMNVSLGTMLHNLTGSWRFIKPIYEDKIPPCQNACPCGNDIEAWIRLIQEGQLEQAYLHLKREEPFPSILGRVCFRFCESQCNRAGLDQSINIRELERYVGDKGFESGIAPEPPPLHGKTLAIVGSGPAGMSAAYFARLLGFTVTIYEAHQVLGGLLRIGIPAYRLPREILDAEIQLLGLMGVEFRRGTRIGQDIALEALSQDYDYIFLAAGAHKSRQLGIPGEKESPRIISGLEFLKKVSLGESLELGRRVVVIGGGNTAIDAARTAVRLGAEQITVLYRRTEAEMPALPDEIQEAREEGVRFQFLAAPEAIELKDNGDVLKLVCAEMELGPPDESGRRAPLKKAGAEFTMEAHSVIVAIGEIPFFPALRTIGDREGRPLQVDESLCVSDKVLQNAMLYAGGDVIEIPHTVVHAVASGKKAAIAMDCHRRGEDFAQVVECISIGNGTGLSFSRYLGLESLNPVRQAYHKVVGRQNIVYDYFEEAPRVVAPVRQPDERVLDFRPYLEGFDDLQASAESKRCIHCGRCVECDNCLVFCPDVAILPAGAKGFGYKIDYDYCKGCGICFTECPRFAISMIDEDTELGEA